MKGIIKKYNRSVLWLVLVALVGLSSCVSQKKIKLMQPAEGQDYNMTVFTPVAHEAYRLTKGDNLYISISTQDTQNDDAFSLSGTNSTAYNSELGVYLNSYTVDEQGNILVPVIGTINVDGHTVEETKALLEGSLSKFVKNAVVVVKMVNFNLTLLGEVSRPGEYKVYQNKINIFEAISLAGDINTYGNRDKVRLLRQNGKKVDMHILDLSDESIIESPYYYLRPNDVVYVEPLKAKQFAFETFPYSLLFSTISTVVMLITFIRSTK